MCPGVGSEDWLRCFVYPSGGVQCRELAQYPDFVPTTLFFSRYFWSGSWFGFFFFFYLLSIICPDCTCTQLFLVPYLFFFFCTLLLRREVCPGINIASLQQSVLSPSLSQIYHIWLRLNVLVYEKHLLMYLANTKVYLC